MTRLAATLTALLVTAPSPARSEPPMSFDALVEPAWKQVTKPSGPSKQGPGVMWRFRVSPPLPADWPMTPKSAVVYWVYAGGFDVSVHDGERVAAPWARIDEQPDGTRALTVLSKALEGDAIQGVKPISKAEAEQVGTVFSTAAALRANDTAALKAAWAGWLRYNGVIASKLRPRHEAFFAAMTK